MEQTTFRCWNEEDGASRAESSMFVLLKVVWQGSIKKSHRLKPSLIGRSLFRIQQQGHTRAKTHVFKDTTASVKRCLFTIF